MKLRFASTMALALGLAAGLSAADDKDKDKNVTVTGCLSMGTGANQNQYVIVEDGTSRRVTLTGSDLAKHNNHKVKITGDRDMQKPDHVTVTKLEMISETCTAR